MKVLRLLAVLAWLCVALACSPRDAPVDSDAVATVGDRADEGSPVRGDWLVLWLLADPESLNPITSNDVASNMVLGGVLGSLLGQNPETLETIPVLATELPTISDDHLTYTFHLRDDATFSDGKPVTVDDVLFSLKAIKNPEVNAAHARNYYLSVVEAQAIDEHTVQFRASEPYFLNDNVLGGISILPRHFYDPAGEMNDITVAELASWETIDPEKKQRALRFATSFNRDFHRKVLGSGAYVLADPERDLITGERIVLRRRDDFWAPGDVLRGDGYVDRFVYRIINNPDAALVALKAGTLDLMGLWRGLTPLQHLKQTNTPGFRKRFEKVLSYSPGYVYLGWNARKPIFADRKVRQALAHFVDRDRIIDKVLFGFGEKVDSPVYKFRPEYHDRLEGYAFDPAQGKRLLEEAGWTDSDGDGLLDKQVDGQRVPLRFELVSNSGNDIRKNVGLIVTDEMRRAGIDASFRELDWSILLDRVGRLEYDAVILGWGMSVRAPDLFQLFHSSQAVPGGSNYISFRNEEADRILVEYRREFDEQRRVELYRRLQEIIEEEAPSVFLFMEKSISAVHRRFRDAKWYPTGGPNVGEWWVPVSEQLYQ